jgi:hypothetical protein
MLRCLSIKVAETFELFRTISNYFELFRTIPRLALYSDRVFPSIILVCPEIVIGAEGRALYAASAHYRLEAIHKLNPAGVGYTTRRTVA